MQKVLNERKNKKIQVHPLIPLYTFCHMRLKCNYLVTIEANDVLPHVPIFDYLNLLLLLI